MGAVLTRRRGRPPLSPDGPSTDVTVAMPGELYDRVYTAAQTARITVPEAIRRVLARELRDTKSTDAPSSLTL